MKCVVTGATGHIGNILVRKLKERGDEVTAFVLPRENISAIQQYVSHVAYGDIRDLESLRYAFAGADIVYHLAGIIDIGSGGKMRRLMYEVNVEGVRNVLQACKDEQIGRLVYTSSVHAITELPHGETIVESQLFNPASVRGHYAKTKAEATALVLESTKEGLDAVIVHPAGIIGPEDYQLSNLGQLIKDFLKRKLPAYISGGYNFVDVRDVACGILNTADKGVSGECYILSGEYHSVRDLLAMMEVITQIKAPRTKIPRWLAFATSPFAELYYKVHRQKPLFTTYSIFTLGTNSQFSNEKARRDLGYTTTPLRKTLEDTIDWIKNHALEKPKLKKVKTKPSKKSRANGDKTLINDLS